MRRNEFRQEVRKCCRDLMRRQRGTVQIVNIRGQLALPALLGGMKYPDNNATVSE
jgi:hypothetical protein